jgi:hypothetical protein
MLSMGMKLHGAVFLLSFALPATAADLATLPQLPTRIGDAHIDVIFVDGTSLRSHLQGTKLANGGTLTIGTWRNRVVACRDIHTITYEPRKRGLARGALGVALGIGVAWGTIRVMGKIPGPLDQGTPYLLLSSPLAGYFGARRWVPRQPQTLSLVCP